MSEPTERQREYARSLANRLEDIGETEFWGQVEDCDDIGEMSALIDEMKDTLEEES